MTTKDLLEEVYKCRHCEKLVGVRFRNSWKFECYADHCEYNHWECDYVMKHEYGDDGRCIWCGESKTGD